MRVSNHKVLDDPAQFKLQLLNWSQQFREVTLLDSNSFTDEYSQFEFALAVDGFTTLQTDYNNAFDDLKQYQQATKDWLFGYLSYDLKNDIEPLSSQNFDGLQFPDLFFFQPKKIFFIKSNELVVHYLLMCDDEIDTDYNEIVSLTVAEDLSTNAVDIQPRISEDDYIAKAEKLLGFIHSGKVYEANLCMEFYDDNAIIDPINIYKNLNTISQAPFTVFLKNNKNFLISSSPERYLQKAGTTVISQPIKGTSRRFSDQEKDQYSKSILEVDAKERAENIMITDLVRNDLSRTATKGSVEVVSLCKVHTFLQVHQLISTISSQVDSTTSPVDVLKTTFPMGSMTGAPKIAAMKIIEELEESKRGLYSGAVGYFKPNGDFDFNVVIRSILYNRESQYVSFSVGSAITALSTPQQEYDECLLKAQAMKLVLTQK